MKVHPSSASQALLEEEVTRFPFKGDPAMWALSISWPPPPNTGAAGSAQPFLITRPGPLELRDHGEGKLGPASAPYPQPGTLDSAGSQATRGLPEEGAAPWGRR